MSYPKIILVTGCAGFIGANFVREFIKRYPKTKIVGIDDFSTGRRDALDKNIVFYEGSIGDEKLVTRVFKKHKPEFVFHFAAYPYVTKSIAEPAHTTFVHIYGTTLLLEKARDYGVKRFIYSSSSAVYGNTKRLPVKESDVPMPLSPYGLQKLVGEPFCLLFSRLYGLETVALRYFNVFGPGQYGGGAYASVISAWLETLYGFKKNRPFLEGDGKQTRDFCYVHNVVEANILAMQTKKKCFGEVVNIGTGKRIDLLGVKQLIERYSGKKLNLQRKSSRVGDIRNSYADITKAKKLLGYRPVVDFETGLRETVKWFIWRTNNL